MLLDEHRIARSNERSGGQAIDALGIARNSFYSTSACTDAGEVGSAPLVTVWYSRDAGWRQGERRATLSGMTFWEIGAAIMVKGVVVTLLNKRSSDTDTAASPQQASDPLNALTIDVCPVSVVVRNKAIQRR